MMEKGVPPQSLNFTGKLMEYKDIEDSSSCVDRTNTFREETDPSRSFHLRSRIAELSSTEVMGDHCLEDQENLSSESLQYQLVPYDPTLGGASYTENEADLIDSQPPFVSRHPFSDRTPKVLPAVGAFTVQCARCFKWRLIPTKEKYEEIREHILQQPFLCETAREWRLHASCDDHPDISPDGSRIWAIDKPNIAQPPFGWQRLLRIRGEGGTRFADVYYVAPTGKRLRSMVEIEKFLMEHPKYMDGGISLAHFSFKTPRPLQENYVRKRIACPDPPDQRGKALDIPLQKSKFIKWATKRRSSLSQGPAGYLGPVLTHRDSSSSSSTSLLISREP